MLHFLYLCVGIVILFLWMCFEIIWFKETRMLAGKLQYFYFVVNLFTFQLISSCHISWHTLVFTKSLLLDEKRRRCCACDFSTAWFARNLIAFFLRPCHWLCISAGYNSSIWCKWTRTSEESYDYDLPLIWSNGLL